MTPTNDPQGEALRMAHAVIAILRREAKVFKERVIRERLSAPWVRGGWTGRKVLKNPLEAGCRKRSGKLQESLRIRVSAPGLRRGNFKGVVTLTARIGGAKAPYASVHEKSGRLGFAKISAEEHARIAKVVEAELRRLAASAGARVTK